MTSMERVLAAINHKEGDRVPLMLLFSMYGAKELKMPIHDYFSDPKNIIAAQTRLWKKYNNDCLYSFFYASIEVEASGGDVIFVEDGPPNSGEPVFKDSDAVFSMQMPEIESAPCLCRVLEATEGLKKAAGVDVPVIGVVMSPFSLPVMQFGFEKYLEILYFQPEHFDRLMRKNIDFCAAWANAQLQAGATAICYFDPLASPTIIDRETYLATGWQVAKETIGKINGPTATHLASGAALPVLGDLADTGTSMVGFGNLDDAMVLKDAARGRLCLLGNLNGIDMLNWDAAKAEREVKKLLTDAGRRGGLIISDCHGEIPWQVSEDVLLAISRAVHNWGVYPLDWVGGNAKA